MGFSCCCLHALSEPCGFGSQSMLWQCIIARPVQGFLFGTRPLAWDPSIFALEPSKTMRETRLFAFYGTCLKLMNRVCWIRFSHAARQLTGLMSRQMAASNVAEMPVNDAEKLHSTNETLPKPLFGTLCEPPPWRIRRDRDRMDGWRLRQEPRDDCVACAQ